MFLSHRTLRATVFAGLLSSLAGLPACSSDKTTNESNPLTADVVREGTTSTAALDEVLGTPATDWGWAGGKFSAPADQAVLPADVAATFTWTADTTFTPDPGTTLSPTQQQGQVFLLAFSTPDNPKLVRVFTSLFAYTPSAASWQTLVSAGAPITLDITTATFENDQLPGDDGGPFSGQPITFTIQ